MASFTQVNYPFAFPVNGVAENCRQAAAQQGAWGMMSNGMVVQHPQWVQQNGQTMVHDLQRPTSFTNGRKRSRENIECEEMKKAKTEMETQFLQTQQGLLNQGFSNSAIAQHQMQLQMQQQQQQQRGFNPCFPSSLLEHQSMMRAERQYDGSLLASIVAEAHGC